MLKVDFHVHTHYSPDSLSDIRRVIESARKRGLHKLVITDHNRLRGALEAYELAPDLVIPGEEVQTTEGEFLAAYVTREVPRGLKPLDALDQLRMQGAFISISHPFDRQRSGWPLESLRQLAPLVDAIEVLNARTINPLYNRQAAEFANENHLPGTAGSDAHHPSEVGRAYSLLPPFTDVAGLREAFKHGAVAGRVSSPLVHFYSVQARIVKQLRQGHA